MFRRARQAVEAVNARTATAVAGIHRLCWCLTRAHVGRRKVCSLILDSGGDGGGGEKDAPAENDDDTDDNNQPAAHQLVIQ